MERMSVKEAAKYLRISEYKLYELVKQKSIPHYRLGYKIAFRKETLDLWIEHQEAQNCVQN